MTTSIPSDQDVSTEISVLQAREWLLLLNAPLSPGECLRRASTLSTDQQATRRLLQDLDNATVPPSMLDKYLDYRRYTKGSILGTLRGVKELGLRHTYITAVQENATLYLDMLRNCENDAKAALHVAEQAVLSRNLTRELFAAHSARASAELQRQGWAAVKSGTRKMFWNSVKDKRSFDTLLKGVAGDTPFEQLSEQAQKEVVKRLVQQSGKAGTLSTAWKTFKGVAAPLQLTIDLLLIADDARHARDPLRSVASGAVRIGTALAVSTLTEAAAVTLVGVLAIGSGWGAVVFIGGTLLANYAINDWVNSTFIDIYDQFNPRIAQVLRDVSWEPENFSISMQGEVPALSMVEDVKTGMIEAR